MRSVPRHHSSRVLAQPPRPLRQMLFQRMAMVLAPSAASNMPPARQVPTLEERLLNNFLANTDWSTVAPAVKRRMVEIFLEDK